MKKLSIICILIVGVIFISGCTSEEKTETQMNSQNSQESNTHSTISILKPSDVAGFTSNSHTFYSVPINTLYVPFYDGVKTDEGSLHRNADKYTDTLSMDHRNVGEESQWNDQSGKVVFISVAKYDSDPDSSLIKMISTDKMFYEMMSGDTERSPMTGDPYIGDYSYYWTNIDFGPDLLGTQISFIHGTTYVWMYVIDEKDISKNTAIRIAKIIESSLD